MDDNLVQRFMAQVNQMIDYKLKDLSKIESAVVESVNDDGTINIFIPPNSMVYHNIQNQSIFQNLRPGDCVKVIKEKNDLSNMWVIGGFQKNINTVLEEKNNSIQMLTMLQKQADFLDQIRNNMRRTSFSVISSTSNLNNLELNEQVGMPAQIVYYIPTNPGNNYLDLNYPAKRGGLLECMGASDARNSHLIFYFEKYFCIPEREEAEYTSSYFRIGTQNLDDDDSSIQWTNWLYM